MWSGAGDSLVTGLRTDRREVLTTSVLDAIPTYRTEDPEPTIWPLLSALAVGVTFVVAIFHPVGIAIGAVLVSIGLIGWFWPRGRVGVEDERRDHRLLESAR